MYLLVVDFPDESHATDHLHVRLDEAADISAYLDWFRLNVGDPDFDIHRQSNCQRCLDGSETTWRPQTVEWTFPDPR